MPNVFDLCIYFSGQVSWSCMHTTSSAARSQVRVGVADLGVFLRSQIRLRDAIKDLKSRVIIAYLKWKMKKKKK